MRHLGQVLQSFCHLAPAGYQHPNGGCHRTSGFQADATEPVRGFFRAVLGASEVSSFPRSICKMKMSARQEGAARLGRSLRTPKHQGPRCAGVAHLARSGSQTNPQACSDDPRPFIPERRSRRLRAALMMEELVEACCQRIAMGTKWPCVTTSAATPLHLEPV